MMATEFCRECHQPISHVVEGVRLTKFKADLFRYIETHPGQSSADLGRHFYEGTGGHPARIIQSHVHQINEALMNTGVRIKGDILIGYRVIRDAAHR